MTQFSLESVEPKIDPSAYVAPNTTIIGDVTIGRKSSVWFSSVARGDDNSIVVGDQTNIQDLSILHADANYPLTIGSGVTVGHRCVVHGCTIEDECLIGMGAIIMNGAKIGRGSIIAAGSVVMENVEIPPFSLVAGVPGKVKRTYDTEILERIKKAGEVYVQRGIDYKTKLEEINIT